jgi:hypothetical protein
MSESKEQTVEMTTPETLSGIFFEPGRTFEALRARPRFLAAAIIIVVLSIIVAVVLFQKIDFIAFMREQIDKGPNADSMAPEQKEAALRFWGGPFGKLFIYVFPFLGEIIIIAAGAALYMLGAMFLGRKIRYKQALSVWTYSSLPPTLLASIASIIVLLLKAGENIDPTNPGGLVRANLSVLLGAGSSPALTTLLGAFDVFVFYGLFLAALGMRKIGKLPSGSAWLIVAGLWLIKVLVKVGWLAIFAKAHTT